MIETFFLKHDYLSGPLWLMHVENTKYTFQYLKPNVSAKQINVKTEKKDGMLECFTIHQ